MSKIQSSSEHLTLNADGSSKDIKFQANGVEKASISSAGAFTSTTIDATKLTGNLPAISGANLTGISSVGGATGVDFNDSIKARFGTGNDLEIYHDGTHSYIKDVGTGDLRIKGTNLSLRSDSADEPYINCTENGSVDLFYNNSKVLNTKTLGVLVSGNIEGYVVNDAHYGATFNSSTGGSGTKYHLSFNRQGTQAGYLTSGPTTVGLNNASDERLKENIQDSASATQDIKNIKVRQFDWKNNRDVHKDYGFVAQELVTVVPEAVAVGSDELNEDGTPVQIWGVDDSKLIPRLVKTIQELEARIAALEA